MSVIRHISGSVTRVRVNVVAALSNIPKRVSLLFILFYFIQFILLLFKVIKSFTEKVIVPIRKVRKQKENIVFIYNH